MALGPVRERPHLPQLISESRVVAWSNAFVSALTSIFQEIGFTINRLRDDTAELQTDLTAAEDAIADLESATGGLGTKDFDSNGTTTNIAAAEGLKDLGVSVTVNIPTGRSVMLFIFIRYKPNVTGDTRNVSFHCPEVNDEFMDTNQVFFTTRTPVFNQFYRNAWVLYDNNPTPGSKSYTLRGSISTNDLDVEFVSLRAVVTS